MGPPSEAEWDLDLQAALRCGLCDVVAFVFVSMSDFQHHTSECHRQTLRALRVYTVSDHRSGEVLPATSVSEPAKGPLGCLFPFAHFLFSQFAERRVRDWLCCSLRLLLLVLLLGA